MRVLVLSMWLPNAENAASGTFVLEQARALRAAGAELRLVQPLPFVPPLAGRASARYARLASIPAAGELEGFEVHYPRYLSLPRHLLFDRAGRWMAAAIRPVLGPLHARWPFELILAHTTYPCGRAANLVRDGLLHGVRVVHTIHGTCVRDAPSYDARCRREVARGLAGADCNVFVSREVYRRAAAVAGPGIRERSRYLTNGVDPARFVLTGEDRARVAALRQRYAGRPNLLFVGNVSEAKGVNDLLLALRRCRAAMESPPRLFLVGNDRVPGGAPRLVRETGLADDVVLTGPVPHGEVKTWMSFADAFVLPSHAEGLPTVMLECLFLGVPSVFTAVGGIPDVVRHGEHVLLVPPRQPDALAEAIRAVLEDAALRERLSRNGAELVRAGYTWEHNARRSLELYDRLLEAAPLPEWEPLEA